MMNAASIGQGCFPAGSDAVQGLDGWLFAADAVRLLTGQSGGSGEAGTRLSAAASAQRLAAAWNTQLAANSQWLSARGIRYFHITVPDKLSVHGELLAGSGVGTLDAGTNSPMQQLTARYRAQQPGLLDPAAYLKRQKDNYPLYWKTDTRWSPWACYMGYQLLCGQLGVRQNNQLLGYPFSEATQLMNLDGGRLPHDPQQVRTYRLALRSRRRHANALVLQREALLDSADPALSLDAYGQGAQVVFENRHLQASELTVMLFGDANSADSRILLSGMLAETFTEVHFAWSPALDFEYIERVKPDIVITQASELQFARMPVESADIRSLASSSMHQLLRDLDAGTVRRRPTAAGCKKQTLPPSPALHSTRLLLASEDYELAAPGVLQPHGDFAEQQTRMASNEVSLTEVQNADVYFTGANWLVHDGAGQEVLRHEVPLTQGRFGRWTRRQQLPGLTLLFASSAGAHCYYHWMLEILPKLGLLEREGVRLDSIDHFLVRRITSPWQLETLLRFGIDASRIVETEKKPHLAAERLLHIDLNCGINLRMHRFIPQWMKHLYPLPGIDLPRLKLYITRPEGVRRGIRNEPEFLPMLQQAGFTIVAMEGLSVAEQAALLARTDVLMSPHGGALTNMVFCRPGITVIELFSRHVFPYYYGLAANCGHNYHAILENSLEDYPRLVNSRVAQSHADTQHETAGLSFTVPVAAIRQLLDGLQDH
jgi:capsular polysaccharide biosynthesis protein